MGKVKSYRKLQTVVILFTLLCLLVFSKTLNIYLNPVANPAENSMFELDNFYFLVLTYASGGFFFLASLMIAFWLDRPLMQCKIKNVIGKTIRQILTASRCPDELQELAAENGINIIITPRTIEIPDSVFYHCYPADLGALIEALLWANANEIYHSANRAQNQNSVFGQLVKILVRHYSSSQIDRCLKPFKNQWLKVILVTAINQCQLELVKQQEWLDGQCRLEQLAKQTETNLKQVRKLSRFSSLSRYLIAKTFGLQPKTKFSQLIPVVQLPPHQSVTPQEVAELTGAKPKAEISAA